MLDNRTVGKTIAALRQANDMTQQKLAATMNVSHQAVSKWENGAALPDMQTMLDLSRLFGVTIEQLLLGEVPEERLQRRDDEENKPQMTEFQLPDFSLRGAMKDVVTGFGNLFGEPENTVPREENEDDAEIATYEAAVEREVEAAVSDAVDEAAIEEEIEREVEEEISASEESAENGEETTEEQDDPLDINRLCQMAPFMSSEALDELLRQYRGRLKVESVVRLAPFVSRTCLEEMIWQLDGTIDWDMLHRIAPFLGKETLEKLVRENKGKVPVENISRIAPFISKECLEELLWRADGTLDWNMLRRFAPFLGRQAVDRMALAISKGEKIVRPVVEDAAKKAEELGKTIHKKTAEVDWNVISGKISRKVDKAVRGAVKFGESVVREVGKVFEPEKPAPEKKPSDRIRETRRRMFERAMQDEKWDWIAERMDDLEDEKLKSDIISRAAELGMVDWLSANVDGYISEEMVRSALAESNWDWLAARLDEIDDALHEEIARAAVAGDGFDFVLANVSELRLGSAALEIALAAVRKARIDVVMEIVEEHLNADEALIVAITAIDSDCEELVNKIAEHLGAGEIDRLCLELAGKEKWDLLHAVIEHADSTTVDAVCLQLAGKRDWARVNDFIESVGADAIAEMMDMAVDIGNWEAIEMLEKYIG